MLEPACVFCHPKLEKKQNVILENEYCRFLQLEDAMKKGVILEGAGVIVPKAHRETVFELTEEECNATFALLREVKKYIDKIYQPQGYNLGWNCGEIAGQHLFHAHFHVLPRYKDEKMVNRGIRFMFKDGQNERFSNVLG
ncbi:HIT domain-containing protein [Oceanobacillus piezotolerans]|uniref:HIT domain-containing protein n=1 Tax=Oceanobacillus piezotolerans TaxID=2448030 RepID=A0A498DDS3_9BACI|nr:HIT domain-containing protein [Oceanobacillus piezotolerans]RLL45124.1 HIT domain-containing protein [Oceanobacillus piezotolerans]